MITCFNAAKTHCRKNKLKISFLPGDFNERQTAWVDTTLDGFGKNLLDFCGNWGFVVSSPFEFSFVKDHITGGSASELFLWDSLKYNLLSDAFAFVVRVVEVFSSGLFVGYWPTCYELNITKRLNYSQVRQGLLL